MSRYLRADNSGTSNSVGYTAAEYKQGMYPKSEAFLSS
jgi:hypothetical protein